MASIAPLVLIVDDHEDSLAMYAVGLLALGFEPVTAATAAEAFAVACDIKPEVIVADLGLPGVSGLELTRRLRQDERTRSARIIVLTGDGAAHRRADDAGCDCFLVKPCPPDALARAIREILVSRSSERLAAR